MNIKQLQADFASKQAEFEACTDVDKGETLVAEMEAIQAQITQLDKVAKMQASMPSVVEPKAKVSSGISTKEGFEADPKLGFQSAGEMISVAYKHSKGYEDPRIACAISRAKQDVGDNHNTIEDGIEIPSELRPEVENKAPVPVAPVELFMPFQASSKYVEFYKDPKNYGASDGLVVDWVPERGQIQKSVDRLEQGKYSHQKVAALVDISAEDMQDAPQIETRLLRKAPILMQQKIFQAILNGTGANQPLGFTNSGALIEVTRQANSDIQAQDILNMLERTMTSTEFGGSYIWFISPDCRSKIVGLKDGTGQYIYKEDVRTGWYGGQPLATLFGRPIYWTEEVNALGAGNEILLVNPEGYICSYRGGSRVDRSMHFWFDTDREAIRWIQRFGGAPIFETPYTMNNGSAVTLSPFIGLTANV